MIKLQRTLLVFVFAFCLSSINGQTIFRWKGGLNFSTIAPDSYMHFSDSKTAKPGFHIGFTKEKPLNRFFSLESGLNFSTKGQKFKEEYVFEVDEYSNEEPTKIEAITNVNLFYLEIIPITGKISYDLGAIKVYGTFGPFISLGLMGHLSIEDFNNGISQSKESNYLKWGWSKNELRPLDLALTSGIGIEKGKMQLGINYNWGIIDIASYTDIANGVDNRTLSISAAYDF